MGTCPTCRVATAKITHTGTGHWCRIECAQCGLYEITDQAINATSEWQIAQKDIQWVPYTLRSMQKDGGFPRLTTDALIALRKNLLRPSAAEAADNLIRFLGTERQPGEMIALDRDAALPYVLGVSSVLGIRYLADELVKEGLVKPPDHKDRLDPSPRAGCLSIKGWARYEELKRGAYSGRYAFMAMQFGDAELGRVVEHCLKPAVDAAGFELRLLNDPEHQKAGLIDDRLRLQIKGARFLIADLTHNNNGSYWEAGYGEGLGKPVIYTCKKDVFENRKGGSHFDTNHNLHILWQMSELERTAELLKACIRATVPESISA